MPATAASNRGGPQGAAAGRHASRRRSSSASSTTSACGDRRRDPITTLPVEVAQIIFVSGVLTPHQVAPLSAVCSGWNARISDPWVWRQLARRMDLVPPIAASAPPAARDDESGVLDRATSWKTWVLAHDRRAAFHGSHLGPWCPTPPRLAAIQHVLLTRPPAITALPRPKSPAARAEPGPFTDAPDDLNSAQEEERISLYHSLFSESKGDDLMFPDEIVIPLPHDGTIAVWTSKMLWTLDAQSGAFLWGRRIVGETGHGFVAEDGIMVLNRYIRKQGSHNLGVWKSEERLGLQNPRKGVYVSMGALPYSDIPSGLYGLQMKGSIVAALTGVGDVLFWDTEHMRHYRTLDLVVFPRSLVRRPWSASYTFDDTYFFITEDARLGPELFGAAEGTAAMSDTKNKLTNIWAIHMDTNTVVWSLHHGALPFAEGMEDAFTIPPRASEWTITWPSGSSYGQARTGHLFPILRNISGARPGLRRKSLPGQPVGGNWNVLSCSSPAGGPGTFIAAHNDRLLVMADYTAYFAAIRSYGATSRRPHAPHTDAPVPRPVAEPDFPLSQPALFALLIPPADTSPKGLYSAPEDALFRLCARAGGAATSSPYFASGIWASSHPPVLINFTTAALAATRGESRLDLIYVTDLAAARAPDLVADYDPVLHPDKSRPHCMGAEHDGYMGKGKGRSNAAPWNSLAASEEADDRIESITELMGSTHMEDAPSPACSRAGVATVQDSANAEDPWSRIQAYRARTSRALLVLLRNRFNTPAAVALTPSCAYVLYRSLGRAGGLNPPLYGRGIGGSALRPRGSGGNPLGTPGSPRAAAALASAACGDLSQGLACSTQLSSILRVWDFAMSGMLSLEPEGVAQCLALRGAGLKVSAPFGRGGSALW